MGASSVTGVYRAAISKPSTSKPGLTADGLIIISEPDLLRILQHAFDEGWVGCKDTRDDVAETLIFGYLEQKRVEEEERIKKEEADKKAKLIEEARQIEASAALAKKLSSPKYSYNSYKDYYKDEYPY